MTDAQKLQQELNEYKERCAILLEKVLKGPEFYAPKAQEIYDEYVQAIRLWSMWKGDHPPINSEQIILWVKKYWAEIQTIFERAKDAEKALRLLAAVEAGTHKVVPANLLGCQVNAMAAQEFTTDNGNSSYVDLYRVALQAAPDFFAEDGK